MAFCCPLLSGYGLTEACAFNVCVPPDCPVRSLLAHRPQTGWPVHVPPAACRCLPLPVRLDAVAPTATRAGLRSR